MRILGYLFIIAGVGLCFTYILMPFGLGSVCVGALLLIAGKKREPSTLSKWVDRIMLAGVAVMILAGVGCWVGLVMHPPRVNHHKSAEAHMLSNCTTTEECQAIAHADAEKARKERGWGKHKKSAKTSESPAHSNPEPSTQP